METSIFFHNLYPFTFAQFLQTWGLYAFVAFCLSRFRVSDRFLMTLPWLSLWILFTPHRPPGEDIILMLACYILTSAVYRRVHRIVFRRRKEVVPCK